MMKTIRYIALVFLFVFVNGSHCAQNEKQEFVNTKHLDHLYEEREITGKTLGIIHIYSEYPDYHWVGDDDEGMSCVDDVARAAIFYMKHSSLCQNIESRRKAERLIEFVLYMQAENGFFYNFIFPDYTINKSHINSLAIPNWWSWRALWALSEAHEFFKDDSGDLFNRISNAENKIIEAMKIQFSAGQEVIDLNGFRRPSWLPYKYASDQAAQIVVALSNYYKSTNDSTVLPMMEKFCDGIMLMQEGDKEHFPYAAMLSWENLWHAWGNMQSNALLKSYEITGNKKYLNASLSEINYFYQYLLDRKFVNEFSIKKENNVVEIENEKVFSQIAYGISPMVFACVEAEQITKEEKYGELAAKISSWFFGNNPAAAQMYFPESGVCYDGIISDSEVNRNSGAESTIEALLTLIAIENNQSAKSYLLKEIKK
ncbi:MAG: hypothetical protein V1720_08240 [bacterium]